MVWQFQTAGKSSIYVYKVSLFSVMFPFFFNRSIQFTCLFFSETCMYRVIIYV